MTDNAKFRWQGSTYACRIIGEGTEGRTRVEALEHGPRFAVGTELEVTAQEIILPFDTSTPPVGNDPKALQAAMDEERTTLPTVAEVLANPNPTPPLSASSQAAATQTERPMADANETAAAFSRIQEKAKLAAGAPGVVAAAVEATLDDILAKKQELLEKNKDVHARHTRVIADASAGLEIMDSALRQISNGGPA